MDFGVTMFPTDYAIRVADRRCIVEVKELASNDEDKHIIENMRAGIIESRWVAPGKRLRPAIRGVRHTQTT